MAVIGYVMEDERCIILPTTNMNMAKAGCMLGALIGSHIKKDAFILSVNKVKDLMKVL